MASIAKINFDRKQAGLPLVRFDLRKLQPEDIEDLRDAYAAMYEISETAVGDRRGYVALARGHGYDQELCHDDSRIFLTWHRAYVYAFEKALNSALQWKRGDSQLELTLPYWNWTVFDPSTDAANGLPTVLDDANYTDASGNQQPNPLARASSLFRQVSRQLVGDEVFTQRFPGSFLAIIPDLADDVARYMTNPNFSSFQSDFNGEAHGDIHVNVGGIGGTASPLGIGDMRSVVTAAFDPLFWLHHSMCDKVWFDWQANNPNANVPQHVLETPVYGGQLGSVYIDAEASLRYIYSSDSVESATIAGGTVEPEPVADAAVEVAAEAQPEETPAADGVDEPPAATEVNLGEVSDAFVRAQLDFHQLRPPTDSFEIRAFLDNPDASAETPRSDDSYAGRLVLFGHGNCHGADGHCNPYLQNRDAYDLRSKHPLRYRKTTYSLDMTRGLRRYLAGRKKQGACKVYLVTIGGEGQQVPAASVKYRGVSLRTFH